MAYTIAVVGSPHSGSTILARWLSQLDRAIALGEVESVLRSKLFDKNKGTRAVAKCSCGRDMDKCPIWQHDFSSYDEIRDYFNKNYIIDSSKKYTGDFNVFIYKNPFQLARSARSIRDYLELLKQTVKSWLRVRSTRHLAFSYTYFTKYPEDVLNKVANAINADIDWQENSHIAYSNRSKYAPLVIKKK